MTYRIVDVATETQVGSDIVSTDAGRLVLAKASMLARLAGGSFRVDVWNGAMWGGGQVVTEEVRP